MLMEIAVYDSVEQEKECAIEAAPFIKERLKCIWISPQQPVVKLLVLSTSNTNPNWTKQFREFSFFFFCCYPDKINLLQF